ncbi:MarR family winged helix-turn-helix transcriptional regulator [Microbacterium sp. ARD31]|uniref:MarR family winged helix-turn-helix transcriptional regulator n=1 Tax=Microbacterium sp. ARD31 TaxID=2962576 RepID=UPI002881F305|nr:MarR family winged helix-turn-helix transcriptional regulator [Microbacterium sp. ARD31]MDT0184013.1 MarR family winged helix-turn-helix transcriptional regulator [Microbacterium sp. ARD31]
MTTDAPEAAPTAGPSIPVPASASTGPISHAIFRVTRLHKMYAGQLLRRVGLHPAQELVMMHLWDRGPQRQGELARLLDSDAATMTRTVQRLENAGFVRRRPCETDGRVTIVEPTAASLALRAGVENAWAELEAGSTQGLSEVEQKQLLALLSRVESSLSAATGSSGIAG